jgi:quinoprotein dehydrogenase-associated probable ABC transporter substrate-binding protein
MCSLCRRAFALVALVALVALASTPGRAEQAHVLRACADPNDLPFSNDREQGFENRIVRLIAADLGMELEYLWWAQRRGFIRNTLNADRCDVVAGVPAYYEPTLTTRPYYRSSYVALTRLNRDLRIWSLNDPMLRELRIGVQMIGDDFANTPPAHELSRRGIVDNVRGYPVYGNYAEANPSARIVRAVASGEIDLALVWGPLAGYFAALEDPPLALTPLAVGTDDGLPFAFDIAIGVRKQDRTLRDLLDDVLARRKADIDRILAEYHVPRVAEAPAARSDR